MYIYIYVYIYIHTHGISMDKPTNGTHDHKGYQLVTIRGMILQVTPSWKNADRMLNQWGWIETHGKLPSSH